MVFRLCSEATLFLMRGFLNEISLLLMGIDSHGRWFGRMVNITGLSHQTQSFANTVRCPIVLATVALWLRLKLRCGFG